MANPYFQFKKFTVWHDKCAMKVGTDGVLLGAWANVDLCQHILDIGTGTGLIALMLAQRSEADIDAIDIDADACEQAKENAEKSPFKERIKVFHSPLNQYKSNTQYDLIVSNPPYFVDSLKCPDGKRNLARHTDTLSLDDLVEDSMSLLSPTGKLALIIPFDQRDLIISIAKKNSLFVIRETHVLPTPQAAPKRLLIELSKLEATPQQTYLTIEIERHQYTEAFIQLAKDFYLKM